MLKVKDIRRIIESAKKGDKTVRVSYSGGQWVYSGGRFMEEPTKLITNQPVFNTVVSGKKFEGVDAITHLFARFGVDYDLGVVLDAADKLNVLWDHPEYGIIEISIDDAVKEKLDNISHLPLGNEEDLMTHILCAPLDAIAWDQPDE